MNDKAPLPELLQWLAQAPRTYGWSAILAYDRDKTNVVLRQEYIERFDAGHYLPPFSELIGTTDETAEYTYDYVFDAARLSFVNATISNSKAMLTQKVIGGTQLSLSQPSGWVSAQVNKVFSLDAMDGPMLESEIKLQGTSGSVNLAGEVVLDISTGDHPRLTFARTVHEREKGGQHFMKVFGDLRPEQKTIVLNRLEIEADQFPKPERFEVRTHAAPNSHTPGTREYGSGGVLVFVSMEGESNGSIPVDDRDMPFLIPDGRSATVLMGHDFLVRGVLVQACRQFAAGSDFAYKLIHQGPFIERLQATDGWLDLGYQKKSDELIEAVEIERLVLPLYSDAASFSLSVEKNLLNVDIKGSFYQRIWVKSRETGQSKSGDVQIFWDARARFELVLNPLTGTIELVHTGSVPVDTRVKPLEFADFLPFPALAEMVSLVEWMLRDGITENAAVFAQAVRPIDVFRLNSLLFKGDNSVVLDSIHLPGDLALFGDVSPSLTEFVITPLEPIVGHGQNQQFYIEPPRNGVTWSVEPLPGDSGAVGAIDHDGWYTAPAASEIDGVYKRVRVKATLGQHTSTALVTVVVRDISVNPIVQVCGVGQSRAMSAGTMGNGTLTWTIANPGNGASIVPSTEPDVDHLYTAGPYIPGAEFIVDEVVVSNGQTHNQQSAYVVIPHGLVGLQVFYEATANPNQVQCKALFSNGSPTDGFDLEWGLLLGSGSIDDTGLFTLDTAGQHRFAVVSCAWRGPMTMIGSCVLPLPLIPLPDMLKVLGDADRLFSTADASGDEE